MRALPPYLISPEATHANAAIYPSSTIAFSRVHHRSPDNLHTQHSTIHAIHLQQRHDRELSENDYENLM